jgi:hypothetical protein
MFASALKFRLEEVVEKWATRIQRGFIRGRRMFANIVDIEMEAMRISLKSRSGALILFDFGAAFPSLSHDFLWEVMGRIGVPKKVIKAMQALYQDNQHWLPLEGKTFKSLLVQSGVRQGCPLSPLLFVMVTDFFLRALEWTLGEKGTARAYADDIAVVVRDMWQDAPSIARLFQRYGRMSNLHLSKTKCVVVPLWTADRKNVQRLLMEHVSPWCRFQIQRSGKYLGLWIGPDGGTMRWNAPIAKYASRCEQIASLKLGLMHTMMFYRIFALPVLLYVGQFSEPPDTAFNAECAALRKLVKGPGNWIPMKALWNLDQLFHLPVSFPQLKLMALAVRMRVNLTEAPYARQQWEDFSNAEEETIYLWRIQWTHGSVRRLWCLCSRRRHRQAASV